MIYVGSISSLGENSDDLSMLKVISSGKLIIYLGSSSPVAKNSDNLFTPEFFASRKLE